MTKIIDITKRVYSGGTPNTRINEYWNGDIKWLSSGETRNNFVYDTDKKITEIGVSNSSTKLAYKNSIVMACAGQGFTRGQTSYLMDDMYINQSVICIEPDEEKVDGLYLYYYLKNSYQMLRKLSDDHSSRGSITTAMIKNLEVDFPNIVNQRKISTILYSLDKKIELNNKLNNNLYEDAVALFNKNFPRIQKGNKTIGEYLIPKRGKNLLTRDAIDGDIPVVAGGIEPSTYHNQFNTKSPVITISASGANAGYTNLWSIPVWASDCSYIDDSITKNVYFWYIVLKTRQNEIFDAQTGSAQPHIYPQHIAEMSIDELNIDEVEKYDNLVAPFFKMIGKNQKQNKKLSQLRDTLLSKLMNGEIDLDNIEI